MHSFAGTPDQIGRRYGSALGTRAQYNVQELLRTAEGKRRRSDAGFRQFMRRQEASVARRWPWLMEEMVHAAAAAGVGEEEWLMLNLRAWQYDAYGGNSGGCSSLGIRLADGTMALAGALDDPPAYYCGPVSIVPDRGFRFVSFPLSGTCWANRGMNSAGLSVSVSSQQLPGVPYPEHAVNQDIALRVILQTMATVPEVREFCREVPFVMNLLCTDEGGRTLCGHQTTAGWYELPFADYAALTNHIADDACVEWLQRKGVRSFPEMATSRPRRNRLLAFAKERAGCCGADEVRRMLGGFQPDDAGSIHHRGTLALTYSNPCAEPGVLYLLETDGTGNSTHFIPYTI